MEKEYEYVLIDSALVLAQGDVVAVAANIGGIIIVIDWLKT